MRFAIIFTGLAALTATAVAAPQGSTCFDDGDCFFAGGTCVKSSGSITGTCSGKSGSSSSSAAFSIPTSFNLARAEDEAAHAELSARSDAAVEGPAPTAGPKLDHLASRDVNDIAEIARRVATRTDLPSEVIEAARKLANRGDAAKSHAPAAATAVVHAANISDIPSS